jgi:PASTA domain
MNTINTKTKIVAGALLGLAMIGACGAARSGGDDKPAPAPAASSSTAPSVETVAQPPVTVTEKAPTSKGPAPAETPAPAPSSTTSKAPTSEAPADVKVPMPDVVGMNLQAAQDKIQETGIFFSRSEDATGAGRMQINDSNWTVVAQSPAAGELIGEGDALLSVVKNTD